MYRDQQSGRHDANINKVENKINTMYTSDSEAVIS